MPRLRLYLDHVEKHLVHRFIRPDGSTDEIPCLRLITYANLFGQLVRDPRAAKVGITKCVIDTGAYISIVAERVWQFFRPGVVTPLPFHPSTPPRHREIVIGGGSFPFELGEISPRLEDRSRQSMWVTLVAKFTRDGGRLTTPLTLGLRGGAIDGRTLHAEPDPAAPHAQAWALSNS